MAEQLNPCGCGKTPRIIALGGYEVWCDCGMTYGGDSDVCKSREKTIAGWNKAMSAAADTVTVPTAWVPVSERLPEAGVTVLALWLPEDRRIPIDPTKHYGVATYWPGHWHNPEDDEDQYVEPTYWMPLPAPPMLAASEGG